VPPLKYSIVKGSDTFTEDTTHTTNTPNHKNFTKPLPSMALQKDYVLVELAIITWTYATEPTTMQDTGNKHPTTPYSTTNFRIHIPAVIC
jgi:hypothetical protein